MSPESLGCVSGNPALPIRSERRQSGRAAASDTLAQTSGHGLNGLRFSSGSVPVQFSWGGTFPNRVSHQSIHELEPAWKACKELPSCQYHKWTTVENPTSTVG